jgi:dTDP-4-amino-4,6-dideoxygalactose transaminase
LQAALLIPKLKHLDEENAVRQQVARRYLAEINNAKVTLPQFTDAHVWHVFAVRTADRDKFQDYLSKNGVQTVIHYPIPPHKQEAYSEWGNLSFPISEKIHREIISLPISPVMTEAQVQEVIWVVNNY